MLERGVTTTTYRGLAVWLGAGLLAILSGIDADAAMLVRLEATERGWVSATGGRSPNGNYLARETGRGDRTHNYFVFDLSGVDAEILGAQLELFNPSGGAGGDGVYRVFGGGTLEDSFLDIVDGPVWGERAFSPADNVSVVVVPLNAGFLDAANGSDASLLVSGSVTQSFLFGFSQFDRNPTPSAGLVLTVVPEPSVAIGCLAGVLWCRRRARCDRWWDRP